MTVCTSEFHSLLDNLLLFHQTQHKEDYLRLREELIVKLDEEMNQYFAQQDNHPLDHIQADIVTIEVVDQLSGQIFRRKLDVDFFENHNGLKLTGETLEGSPSEIVFLSNYGLKKINDLVGNGPNEDLCDTK